MTVLHTGGDKVPFLSDGEFWSNLALLYFLFSGKPLNAIGYAQVCFRLFCRSIGCCVYPREAGLNRPPSEREVDFAQQKTKGACESFLFCICGYKTKLHALSFSHLAGTPKTLFARFWDSLGRQLPLGGSLRHKCIFADFSIMLIG